MTEPNDWPSWRPAVLQPPSLTEDLPGIGGRLRARPEDFAVEEIPAYEPDGRSDGHLFVQMTKHCLSTHAALRELADALDIDVRDLGSAGRKDTVAVTTQWISVPAAVGPALAGFHHPQIELGPAHPHGSKLKTGHLHGNRFELTVRDLACDLETALLRVQAKLARLRDAGGLPNVYGPQRFGRHGDSLDRGLKAVAAGKGGPRGNMIVAAGQAGLFNLTWCLRRARGIEGRVLEGDLLKKRDTGGLFYCDDPQTDQERFDAGLVDITGPIFGSKMRAPPEGTAADALEKEVLEIAGVRPTALRALGKRAMGTRRVLRVALGPVELHVAKPEEGLSEGLTLRFQLPAGSFATTLLAELQHPATQGDERGALSP